MTEALYIHNVRIVRPGVSITPGSLLIRDGCIEKLDAPCPQNAVAFDGGNSFLTPGLIDLHTHGIGHFLYERSPEEIVNGSEMLPQFGTTCALPTLYRVMNRAALDHLARLTAALDLARGASFPGFHLEGPFLALPGAGAECRPGDIALLDDLLSACAGKVIAMSVSPDTPNIIPVIERLVARGVVPLVTHTRATVEQTLLAIAAGARHATHFYDVFPMPPEVDAGVRPCGAVETFLADSRCSVDFIADGVHVDPVAIRCAIAAKGFGKVLLITDSNIGAGLPPGVHETPWGFSVQVAESHGARVSNHDHRQYGTLAGSTLTMDAGMRNLHRWLDLPPEDIWAMGTLNVANRLGLRDLGRMEPGAAADLVLWDDRLNVLRTWIRGETFFSN